MTTTEANSVFEEPPAPQRLEHDPEDQEEAIPPPEQVGPPPEAGRTCDPFIDRFPSMMNHDNISAVLDEQAHMMSVFEVTNEKLASVNRISERSYFNTSVELRQTTKTPVTIVFMAALFVHFRKEALALQEHCAQTCTAHYRAPELFEVPSNCTITAKTDV
ncbi:uncharacterized protein LOC135338326 [Halichondria panicea]|uniref:uncharacterized protein LOC135338326 n=1 Tax=Halichondria panicea TaxID=6063 RepID=UPI00312B6F25